MPWPCKINEQLVDIGDMQETENGDWYVVLPNGAIHNIHAKFRDGSGWQVTGEAPNFTVKPSIRCYEAAHNGVVYRREWHGYITDGVLSDDCEGRVF